LGPNHGQEGLDLVVYSGFQLQVSTNPVVVIPVVRTLVDGVGKELVLLRDLILDIYTKGKGRSYGGN
jgi:hypothetical protein